MTWRHIFLIGPGGTGKSTLGPTLARLMGAAFVDLDLEVCERVAPIPELVDAQGYAVYCRANSDIAAQLVSGASGPLIMATSSGFLTHDDQPLVVEANLALIRRCGTSVLVLPSEVLDQTVELIVDRQALRWGELGRGYWRNVTRKRLLVNRELADIEVVVTGSVESVSMAVLAALADVGLS